ncbi:uncharacterized protein LOC114348171 [Diabrotica virgifera virgifera]|uniref:CHK kinase-like domain-containing protein n=1 Tax=Diabrotica virgifera virgifera TaxID=50390 RepID=A0ABM5IZZ5_DIAVI|nr:uncharacterized protein LOC114348171 [Diabrotica virgifera virgifera]
MDEIRDLEELLGIKEEVRNVDITSLTAPGDNFGSLMLKVDVTLKDKILHLVAKKIPQSVLYQKIFNIQVTYRKEVELYKSIVPILEEFAKKRLEFFPRYYASRYNLKDNDDVIDEDAVLVLENLAVLGYRNLNKKEGFDLQNALLFLEDLAKFHAVPLAFKLKHPNEFDEKIKKLCFNTVFTDAKRYGILNEASRKIVSECNSISHLADKILFLNVNNMQPVSDAYGTLIHFDLWVNNIMVNLKDGRSVGNKLVDFQVYSYGSPASDVLFFLLTSLQGYVIKEHLDELIKHYHDHFVKCLQEFGCDTELYTLENLLEELRIHSKFEYGHAVLYTTFFINADKVSEDESTRGDPENMIRGITQLAKVKVCLITEECEKRGWLPKLE